MDWMKYPDTSLGEQKRPFGEGFSAFDLLREHFLGVPGTTPQEADLKVQKLVDTECLAEATFALSKIIMHDSVSPEIAEIAKAAIIRINAIMDGTFQ